MNLLKSLPISLIFALVPSAWATSLLYNFDSPTGTLGTSQTYTSNGVAITAYGFDAGGAAGDLYGKNDGGDEIGLGLAENTGDHEIETNDFVQLNLSNLWALDPTSVLMSIGSVQDGESWTIFGSNTMGSVGTALMSWNTDAPHTLSLVSTADSYEFISVQAHSGDVLLTTLSATTSAPEPGSFSFLLIATGLFGMAASFRKVRGWVRG